MSRVCHIGPHRAKGEFLFCFLTACSANTSCSNFLTTLMSKATEEEKGQPNQERYYLPNSAGFITYLTQFTRQQRDGVISGGKSAKVHNLEVSGTQE